MSPIIYATIQVLIWIWGVLAWGRSVPGLQFALAAHVFSTVAAWTLYYLLPPASYGQWVYTGSSLAMAASLLIVVFAMLREVGKLQVWFCVLAGLGTAATLLWQFAPSTLCAKVAVVAIGQEWVLSAVIAGYVSAIGSIRSGEFGVARTATFSAISLSAGIQLGLSLLRAEYGHEIYVWAHGPVGWLNGLVWLVLAVRLAVASKRLGARGAAWA